VAYSYPYLYGALMGSSLKYIYTEVDSILADYVARLFGENQDL